MPHAPNRLEDEDLQLSLYVLYELHYRSFAGVDDRWEWEPSLLELRRRLEREFEGRLDAQAPARVVLDPATVGDDLVRLAGADEEPSLSRYLERHATLEQFEEFVIHRSAYHLREADPHTFAIPRLEGPPKAALVEIQADEYGSGRPERMHSQLFAGTMDGLGLDSSYGCYIDLIPAVTLAPVNLMSLFGLHRRWRGALVGQLALFEMTSAQPNRRYGNGLRRLGFGAEVTDFYDEHVEADSVHENIAAYDMAGALALREPALAPDILFGADALAALEKRNAARLLDDWAAGRSSLRQARPAPLAS
ncbi:MAG: iron-containing redox enzyme family protein [Actinomycetota bacterium]|nr:iron-containing redox enzyme family protein [Actinomycetota bacterium]